MRELQDTFYAYMSERYPDLDRGLPARETGRQHIPTYMFKTVEKLKEHQQEIEEAVRDIGIFGNREKREHALELLQKYAPVMLKAEHHLETTNRYLAELEKQVETGKTRVSELEEKAEMLEGRLTYEVVHRTWAEFDYESANRRAEEAKEKLLELNREQRKYKRILDQLPKDVYEKITGEKGKEPTFGPYSRKAKAPAKKQPEKQQTKKDPARVRDLYRESDRPQRRERSDEYER